MIVRQWHGRVPAGRGEEYLELMRSLAIPDYRRTEGNLGAFCLHRYTGDVLDVTMVSWWRDYAAIAAFAGDDISVAKYYDFDADFLLEMEPHVTHYEGSGDLDRPGSASQSGTGLDTLRDLRAAEDVLFRFAEGQDRKDKTLFASAFSADAVLDFVQPAARFGVELAPFRGRTSLVDTIFQNISGLDTSHTVTNQRIRLDGDRAFGSALVEAQHVLAADPSRHLLLKNFYDTELIRSGARWEMSKVVIRNIWHTGDRKVLFP